jgi:hypothetical protein
VADEPGLLGEWRKRYEESGAGLFHWGFEAQELIVAYGEDRVRLAASNSGWVKHPNYLKAKLKELHPQCFPRVRSTCGPEGRHIRFNCKNEKVAPHFCTLNVSAIKTIKPGGASWLNASIESYRPGSSGLLCCMSCGLELGAGHFECVAQHKLCTGCFNGMVVYP